MGWDQARDSWVVRDILNGQFTLVGPRTGIGHMHLGPLYYYLLAPFYYLTNLDPTATFIFNFICNLFNFIILFYVSKKIYGNLFALFVIFIYTFSNYVIIVNQIPWNVTLMPGVAALIFYSIVRVHQGSYKWIFLAWTLSGFYFHLHFSAVFLPFIVLASLVFVKDKKKALLYSIMSLPLYLVWFLPNIIWQLNTQGDTGHYRDFFKYYILDFHFRFLIHRFQDAFIQFGMIFTSPTVPEFKKFTPIIKVVIPIFFIFFSFRDKNKFNAKLSILIMLWFIVPLIGITLYGGPLSEYYFLYSIPMVLFILGYLQSRILQFKFKYPLIIFSVLFWIFYAWVNTSNIWIKPNNGGIEAFKKQTLKMVENNQKIEFDIGSIHSYLYHIYTVDKVPYKKF